MMTPHIETHEDGRECRLYVYPDGTSWWFYKQTFYMEKCTREHTVDPVSTDEWMAMQERREMSRWGHD
jgi:hypothetical protein